MHLNSVLTMQYLKDTQRNFVFELLNRHKCILEIHTKNAKTQENFDASYMELERFILRYPDLPEDRIISKRFYKYSAQKEHYEQSIPKYKFRLFMKFLKEYGKRFPGGIENDTEFETVVRNYFQKDLA